MSPYWSDSEITAGTASRLLGHLCSHSAPQLNAPGDRSHSTTTTSKSTTFFGVENSWKHPLNSRQAVRQNDHTKPNPPSPRRIQHPRRCRPKPQHFDSDLVLRRRRWRQRQRRQPTHSTARPALGLVVLQLAIESARRRRGSDSRVWRAPDPRRVRGRCDAQGRGGVWTRDGAARRRLPTMGGWVFGPVAPAQWVVRRLRAVARRCEGSGFGTGRGPFGEGLAGGV